MPRNSGPGLSTLDSRPFTRRSFCQAATAGLLIAGCSKESTGNAGKLEKVWGRLGIADGRLQKPRAMAIDSRDQLYIVDMTARIQVFDREGNFLRGWKTPTHQNGRPTGLTICNKGAISPEGVLMVADTHYYQVLFYTTEGELLHEATLGGVQGQGPGQFGLVTDAVCDSHGFCYVAEYGEYDRIQKFSPDGDFLLQWGGHGEEPGQFVRPQNLAIDKEDQLWVADACNHRIQVFDGQGKLVKMWGKPGTQPEQLSYPYDLVFDEKREHLYVCEYGNSRIQKFTLDGQSLGCWGTSGRKPGQLFNPWALVHDSKGRLHVLDTNNHRVQRIVL